MRIGIIFHKDPCAPAAGIDLIRLRALAGGLMRRGIEAEILAPVAKELTLAGTIPVLPTAALSTGRRYDLVKTCYHFSIQLVGRYRGPVVSRIVRVVDEHLPERDAALRKTLLECQRLIRRRARALIVNNAENETRWRQLHGGDLIIARVPNGCPAEIPPARSNPYEPGEAAALFLGSLAAARMVELLNAFAQRLRGRCRVHFIGLNKAGLYGARGPCALDPLIVDHGEIVEDAVWDYIRHARMGIALAAGGNRFDNDISKLYTYLRGGLPVLAEGLIANEHLVAGTRCGAVFAHSDPGDMASKAVDLLEHPPAARWRQSATELMVREHSWEQRVTALMDLINRVLEDPGSR